MHPSLSILQEDPSLARTITHVDLSGEFPGESLRRAQMYLSPSITTDLRAKESDDGNITVRANVQGTRRSPYKVIIEFYGDMVTGGWLFDASCSCPVGFSCKHSAAVMIRLAEIIRNAPPSVASPRDALPRPVEQWLKSIRRAAEAVPAAEKPKPPNQKFLAYCIELPPHGHSTVRLTLHPATLNKSGSVTVEPRIAQADPTRPTKYMVEEDLPVALAYHQMVRKQPGWGKIELEGPEAARLLDLALATGRLFVGRESSGYRPSSGYMRVSRGEPVEVRPGWSTEASGGVKPVIEGLPEGHLLVRSQPQHYIDPATGVMGVLRSHVSDTLLDLWQRGPAVPAEAALALTDRFESLKSASLPAPVPIETEIRADGPFTATLHIRREEIDIGDDVIECVHALASFQYADSPPLPAIEGMSTPAGHTGIRGGKRIIWKRRPAEEQRMVLHLENSGLAFMTGLIGPGVLPSAFANALVTEDPRPSPTLAWLRWLETEAPALRGQGWTIIVDPGAGLTAHDVGGFLPAMEADTGHGVDWFRFDVSFEIGGVKRSLIPLIAQAIEKDFPPATTPDLPEWITVPCEDPADGFIRLPARRFLEIVDQVRHLFLGREIGDGPIKLDRLAAAGIADGFSIAGTATARALAELGRSLKDIRELPHEDVPENVSATLRPYQQEGFRWLRFLAKHHLNGILADDMGLGKTLQTLTHLAAEHALKPGQPSLVVAPTSVVHNWAAEAARFTPGLRVVEYHGLPRLSLLREFSSADLVITSYPLLHRDIDALVKTTWHCVILDEAQHIKNPKAVTAKAACALKASHRICLSGTPMENHLGELWSLMRFLMPGYLPDEKTFNSAIRKPIERDRSNEAQTALNRRVSPLILRRTKDQVATDLPPKTELIHHIDLTKKQVDLYESVRASMDKRVRDAIAAKGLAKSQIIVLDALLKLRQICCHPALLPIPAAARIHESAKLAFLTDELLPQLLEEGRRILLFSQFTSMLELIEDHLVNGSIPHLKLTGRTKDRATLVKRFQTGEVPVFLISLKAGGTGLNLTAADTVIHYDPWWNPAAENQATDRAHRIGQNKPVFVHKLVCRGTIEDRILDLQKHKSALVQALLSEETTSLRIDPETLSHLLAPIA